MSILFSHFLSKYNEIPPQNADFTEVLSTIAVVPKMLYFYGKWPQNRLQSVAIVGTRHPTKYGETVAYELAYAAAKCGAVVVSGLAYGIDSVAHRGAVEAGGVTVAVLGTPIDQVYPRAHIGLAEEIVKNRGVVMSELAPGEKIQPRTAFLRRNRLISGLADVVVVVEAAERSGSLNTAAHALEQGREILAVPGDVTRPMSRGCNRLIQQGAMPYTEPADVLDLLFPGRRASKKKSPASLTEISGDTADETAILRVIAAGVQDGEEIALRAGVNLSEFGQNMTNLELKGRIRALGMNCYALR